MRVFDYESYQEFIAAKLKTLPGGGRGQYRRMAEHLGVHTTLISQIFRGTKLMALEHALGLCDYFGLSEMETEYFLCLVQAERAGTQKLRKIYEKQAERVREKGRKLENRLPRDKTLSESDKAVFYSEWYYSGIRIVTSFGDGQTAEAVAEQLHLPIHLVNRVLEFLVSCGLCVENKKGLFAPGPKRTMLETSSPLIGRHHANWRNRVIEQYPRMHESDFAFTSPLSISEKGFIAVRAELANLVERIDKHVGDGEPEKLVCLNIDWLELAGKR